MWECADINFELPVSLMSEMGYREVPDTESRAASALPFDPRPPTPEEVGPMGDEVREEMERETQEKLQALTFQHLEDLKQIQQLYELVRFVKQNCSFRLVS